jgi:hypothetical protein
MELVSYNIKHVLKEIYKGTNWIYLAQGNDIWRDVVNTEMNFMAPEEAKNFLTILLISKLNLGRAYPSEKFVTTHKNTTT